MLRQHPSIRTVVEAMLPYFTEHWGNPSSIYRAGRTALSALDQARSTVASVLHCNAKELVFTGGGSESDNLAIKGAALAQRQRGKGNHIVTSAIEHHAVLHAVEALETMGFEVTIVPVNADGLVEPEQFRAALRDDTVLATIMYANNEIGTIQPIAELGAICRERGILFHTDAVQAGGALSSGCQRITRRSANAHRAQILWPQRHRLVVRAPGDAAPITD